MKIIKGVGDFFALDIGTTAVRVVQLSKNGPDSWSLQHYGYAPIDESIAAASSAESQRRLGEVIMTAVGQSGIRTKNVVLGLPSNKTFTTVVDVPSMPDAELKATIKYQIDQYIPMSVEDAKTDWVSLGRSLHDPSKLEILITSTANDYAEQRLEEVEALGFNVIALEPDPIAMVRSLHAANPNGAQLIVDMGEASTDLAVTYGDAPRLVRTIPTGLRTLVKAAVQNLGVQEDQARQFILKFGLAPDRLDGQVYRAIESTLDNFASELVKSIKFFQTRCPDIAITNMLISGYASAVPMFGDYVSAKTSVQAVVADPWQSIRVSNNDAQQLSAVRSEFAAVIGLAKRESVA